MSVYTEERVMVNNMAASSTALQLSGRDMGLQLKFAAERGRLQDVTKMLAAGAPILRDPVSVQQLRD